ncbi:hypothetical protein NQ315_013023 [Exocentrus adspersus]|uniref:Uncharacterized protein n=1 Tax=Exocentrus adspersus TaxID=1586481 RepID=A0AAV8VAI3_9CUCU|nr:hypothetical protein NQ315_013023 [Exocentrus adspersus]
MTNAMNRKAYFGSVQPLANEYGQLKSLNFTMQAKGSRGKAIKTKQLVKSYHTLYCTDKKCKRLCPGAIENNCTLGVAGDTATISYST